MLVPLIDLEQKLSNSYALLSHLLPGFLLTVEGPPAWISPEKAAFEHGSAQGNVHPLLKIKEQTSSLCLVFVACPWNLMSHTFDVLPVTHPWKRFELSSSAVISYVQKKLSKDVIISCAGLCFPGDLKPILRLFLDGLQILTAYGLSSHMRYTKTNIYIYRYLYMCVEWKKCQSQKATVFESTCLLQRLSSAA